MLYYPQTHIMNQINSYYYIWQLTFHNDDNSLHVSKSFIAENQDMAYCALNGFAMLEGNFSASIRAVNKMYLRSPPVMTEIQVSSEQPLIIGKHSYHHLIFNKVYKLVKNVLWMLLTGIIRWGNDMINSISSIFNLRCLAIVNANFVIFIILFCQKSCFEKTIMTTCTYSLCSSSIPTAFALGYYHILFVLH